MMAFKCCEISIDWTLKCSLVYRVNICGAG